MSNDAERPRYRRHEWINRCTLHVVYSIQARVGKGGWMNVSSGGRPMLFDTAEQRDAVMEAMSNE